MRNAVRKRDASTVDEMKKNAVKRETQSLSEVNDRIDFSIKVVTWAWDRFVCVCASVSACNYHRDSQPSGERCTLSNCVWSRSGSSPLSIFDGTLFAIGLVWSTSPIVVIVVISIFRFDVCMWFLIFAFVLKCHSMALLFQFIYPHFSTT